MRTRLTRAEKIVRQKRQEVLARDDLTLEHKGRELKLWLGLVVALIGGLLYVNTLGHQYVLDDIGLIPENAITRRGWDGALLAFKTSYRAGFGPGFDDARYRPLSKAMFAVEWGLAPHRPGLGHGVNILLYGLSGFLLFSMLCQYLTGQRLVPFITAALFIAHPIHTEVVANIKGRDEILCFLFFVLSAMAIHRFTKRGSVPFLLLGSAAFFLSLLSKESAFTFLAVIPLMLFFFTDTPRSRTLLALVALGVVASLFVIIRQQVLSDVTLPRVTMIDDYLVAITDVATRNATAVFLMGVYLKLLCFPYPLLSDGSYRHFPTVTVSDWRSLLPFLAYAALAVYALLRLKKKDAVSFSILYFFITASVASNLVFLIGTNYGERLMYAPSLGFCLAIAVLLVRGFRTDESTVTAPTLGAFFRTSRGPLVVLALVVTLYGFETVTRNADWYDNLTLFAKDAHRAPGNARLHYFLGQDLLGKAYLLPATGDGAARKALLTEGITELRKAVELYPEYPSALESLGVAHAYLDDAATARTYFEHALRLEPTFSVHYNFASLLFTLGDWDGAMKHYQFVVRRKPDWAEAHLGLGLALARSGEQSARTAVEERKRNSETGYRENTTAATRSFQEALSHLKRAVEIAPDDLKTWYAVGTLYQYLGDERNARYYLARAAQMKRRVNRPD